MGENGSNMSLRNSSVSQLRAMQTKLHLKKKIVQPIYTTSCTKVSISRLKQFTYSFSYSDVENGTTCGMDNSVFTIAYKVSLRAEPFIEL